MVGKWAADSGVDGADGQGEQSAWHGGDVGADQLGGLFADEEFADSYPGDRAE